MIAGWSACLTTFPPSTDHTMRRKAVLAGCALIAAICVACAGIVSAQTPVGRVSLNGDVNELLRRGQQLEIERRWGDALIHYEDALRQFPDERTLERRFEYTRLHYDLVRRYNDGSFNECLGRMTLNESLNLYNEVLLKVQTHYVEAPSLKALTEWGQNDLDVALNEPGFLNRNVAELNLVAVDPFRAELRRAIGQRTVASRSDAVEAVSMAARLAQLRLGVPATAVVLEFLCGATNALDPYSAYLTPSQLAEVYSQIEGNFVGLGVELKGQNGTLLVVRVISGSPAQKQGIRPGDSIVAVDGHDTRKFNTDQAANLLQGPIGSVANVTVVTPGQAARLLSVVRERVEVPSVDEVQMIDSLRGIAYLKLVCFQKTTSRDLDAALWQLHGQGMRSLILDLRGNPGGLLVTAVEVVDKFVDRGVIVSTRGRNSQEDFTYSAREEGTWHVPLVVLIDQDSASAAEIFAGAIRDHRRAPVIGSRSYGKGSVQGIFPLSQSSAGVRLTTARFYSPNGKPYNRVGVEPDISVRQVAKPVATTVSTPGGRSEDPVLSAAVQQAAAQVGQVR